MSLQRRIPTYVSNCNYTFLYNVQINKRLYKKIKKLFDIINIDTNSMNISYAKGKLNT